MEGYKTVYLDSFISSKMALVMNSDSWLSSYV